MTVVIEPMRWWHVTAVHDLESGLFPDDAWSVEQFWQELAQPTRRYVVARDGIDIVGYAGLFVLAPDADIQTVAVSAGHQGRGIAGRLLESLLLPAEAAGVTHTMLEVRAGNASAIALYERYGFVRLSVRPRYYPDGGDALIMRRARPPREEVADAG